MCVCVCVGVQFGMVYNDKRINSERLFTYSMRMGGVNQANDNTPGVKSIIVSLYLLIANSVFDLILDILPC